MPFFVSFSISYSSILVSSPIHDIILLVGNVFSYCAPDVLCNWQVMFFHFTHQEFYYLLIGKPLRNPATMAGFSGYNETPRRNAGCQAVIKGVRPFAAICFK